MVDANIDVMITRRLRRLSSIKTTPDPHIELAGYRHCHAGV